jgi:glutamine synthetase
MTLTLDSLRQKAQSGDIDTVIVADVDMQGRLYGKRLTAVQFLAEGHKGLGTCSVVLGWGQDHSLDPGYRFTGWDLGYPDFISMPDLSTLRLYGWFPRTAIVFSDAKTLAGGPVAIAPRAILKHQLERTAKLGFTPYFASELEFFLLKETADSAHAKGFVNLLPRHHAMHPETVMRTSEDEDFAQPLRAALQASDVPVELVKAEYSPGQIEVNLRYAPALEAAQRHLLLKAAAKEIALQQGQIATFMAKWRSDMGGSSCHTHMSLCRTDGSSAFEDSKGEPNEMLKAFLAGLLRYGREFFLFFAPTTNSYKRLVPNTFAPARLNWGIDNRTVALRLIGKGPARRIENRIPGADVNPCLVYAGMLAAGLAGIENKRELDQPALTGNAYAVREGEAIPKGLSEAASVFAKSDIVRAAFGAEVQAHYANFGHQTEAAIADKVSDVERRLLLLDI